MPVPINARFARNGRFIAEKRNAESRRQSASRRTLGQAPCAAFRSLDGPARTPALACLAHDVCATAECYRQPHGALASRSSSQIPVWNVASSIGPAHSNGFPGCAAGASMNQEPADHCLALNTVRRSDSGRHDRTLNAGTEPTRGRRQRFQRVAPCRRSPGYGVPAAIHPSAAASRVAG